MSANEKISNRMEIAAACLAAGWTQVRTSRECRVASATIQRWKQLPHFRARVAELRQELVDKAIGRLSDLMGHRACDVLEKLMLAKSDAIKLESVKTIFDLHANTSAAAGLKDRLAAVEEILKGKGTRK
jgi:hypothetical protein